MWPFTKGLSETERAEHNQFVEECNPIIDKIHAEIMAWGVILFAPVHDGSSLLEECRKANRASTSGLDMTSDIEEIREIFKDQIKEAYKATLALNECFVESLEFFNSLEPRNEWPKKTKKLFDNWKLFLGFPDAMAMVINSLEEPEALRIELGAHRLNMFVSGVNLSFANTLAGMSRFSTV